MSCSKPPARTGGSDQAGHELSCLFQGLGPWLGSTYATVQPYIREIDIEGVPVRVLNIDGLLKTKTDYREKDLLDKQVLMRIKNQL